MVQFQVKYDKHKDTVLSIETDEISCHRQKELYFAIPMQRLLCVSQNKKKLVINWLEPASDGNGFDVYGQEMESPYASKIKRAMEIAKFGE